MSFATATRFRPSTSAASDGSRTITIHDSQPRENDGDIPAGSGAGNEGEIGSLRLCGGPRKVRQRRVVWDDDVVDNEDCGRKSSKICCIYHKPKAFDESSDEDSTDTDEDSDYERQHRNHDHHHRCHDGDSGLRHSDGGDNSMTHLQKDKEPNAYESMPGKGKKRAA